MPPKSQGEGQEKLNPVMILDCCLPPELTASRHLPVLCYCVRAMLADTHRPSLQLHLSGWGGLLLDLPGKFPKA